MTFLRVEGRVSMEVGAPVSWLALALLKAQHGVVEAVLVDHGRHALNAEVSLQHVQHVCRASMQTGAPPLLLAPSRSPFGVLLREVQSLQLSLQLAGQRAESGPPPCGGGDSVAGQRGLGARLAAVGRAAVLTMTLPPPQGAGGGSLSEEGAQSSQHAGLRLQTAETQTQQSRQSCNHLTQRHRSKQQEYISSSLSNDYNQLLLKCLGADSLPVTELSAAKRLLKVKSNLICVKADFLSHV